MGHVDSDLSLAECWLAPLASIPASRQTGIGSTNTQEHHIKTVERLTGAGASQALGAGTSSLTSLSYRANKRCICAVCQPCQKALYEFLQRSQGVGGRARVQSVLMRAGKHAGTNSTVMSRWLHMQLIANDQDFGLITQYQKTHIDPRHRCAGQLPCRCQDSIHSAARVRTQGSCIVTMRDPALKHVALHPYLITIDIYIVGSATA